MISRIIVGALALGALAVPAAAADYPAQPIKVILPFGPGTGSDIATRIVLDEVHKQTAANFVIENRAGALGVIGATALLRAPADGYTVLMTGTSSHSLAPSLSKSATYDPLNDFSHVITMTYIPFTVLVPSTSKYDTIQSLIKDIRANPGKLTYGFASGSTRIFGAKFHKLSDIDALGVSYKSSQEALTDLLGGQLDYMVVDSAAAVGIIKGEKARALAMLSDERSRLLPDVPALKELGLPSIKLTGWTGLAGPKGMPDEAKRWLAEHIGAALADTATIEKLKNSTVEAATPVDVDQWVRTQLQSWSEAAKEAGVQPE
ncbi:MULTISPECIES: tripartite tricarboxylate transporter substrate binding protein [unclassified Chelatococcus]|uniref:Bug family tripartite tricarboxylate transporter substrate binding protein n=1 Tax=unclassified Chelatococcus TaxID=2638111 RepID=UPI001BCF2DB4|nr:MULTISPECIES: tripartite tricarboxylate transporter substrate binding protein [unclassified Chelatococcus]MBS7743508.1 tripartite tricarboxylate transporter substrate binding protein [Chelatococcus sp. HY11]MBX3547378.1 tripartite tricarboxylate transporter substrate binding protein [Chelatococcus sp.]CAH1662294.1 putative Protein BugT [Hyphomicrobiales bacterium]CAH1687519.1 putative Protein BugT [Hyphomicrobiales bacterium]